MVGLKLHEVNFNLRLEVVSEELERFWSRETTHKYEIEWQINWRRRNNKAQQKKRKIGILEV